LLRRGKNPVEVGVHAIARYAILYVKSGRKQGNPTSGRGARDIWHPRAQRACGYRVVSLDRDAERAPGRGSDAWREWLACDNRVGPADEAAFRLDFAAWLGALPEKKRWVAELLAEGHEGFVVARLVGIAQSRVSQLRGELAENWQNFQGPASVHEAGDLRMARVWAVTRAPAGTADGVGPPADGPLTVGPCQPSARNSLRGKRLAGLRGHG
jgi:hypothetical protein